MNSPLWLTVLVGVATLSAAAEPAMNELSAAESGAGWKLLFDGKSLAGWRGYALPGPPVRGWSVADGCIKNAKTNGRPGGGGGDIVTTEQFEDFDFRFEWRMSPAGNCGIKYFIVDRQGMAGASMFAGDDGRSAVGFEYQLLDDERHPDAKNGPIRQSGALYSLLPPSAAKRLKPVGEFNASRILVQGKHVEHWLNGVKVVEFELESPAMRDAIAASKYKDVPGFGAKAKTALLIQDHGEEVWLRNLKILPLTGSVR
jgi:hypothetical protein